MAPPAEIAGQGEVIAGDADDNGNPGTVNPSVTGVSPGFIGFPGLHRIGVYGGHPGLHGTGTPQIVAGFSEVSPIPSTPSNPIPAKPYEVAVANPSNLPMFGTELPQFVGGYFLPTSPTAPNMEFTITHFSQLYQQETGKPLTSSSVIYIGTQAGSSNDGGINEIASPQGSSFSDRCRHAPRDLPAAIADDLRQSARASNRRHTPSRFDPSHHRGDVRVQRQGHQPLDGDPGRRPRHRSRHPEGPAGRVPIATYVFVADQLHLPPGLNNVTLSGTLENGLTTFSSSRAVLNIPDAGRVSGPLHRYMGGGSIYRALSKIEAKHPGTVAIPSSNATAVSVSNNPAPHGLAKLKVSYAPVVSTATNAGTKAARTEKARQVVSIPKRSEAGSEASSKLPTKLRHSMSDFLHHT